MESKGKQERKTYYSMKEFEKEFFPQSYKEKLVEKRSKEPSMFGTILATELLKSIRQQLMKQSKFV